jgi:hypothetical protein
MSCIFENTLHYSSPGHGDWGVVRIGMLAPESIQLFVCPSACGRHGAIGAMKQGLKERLFYLYVSQSDIIDGYDGLIPGAVGEVLEAVSPRPKVFFLFVSCLDDLIGTDHDALLEELGRLHPDIQFRVCHMNPISLSSKTPPPVSIQNNLYSLLRPEKIHDSGINAVGNLEITAPSSELYGFLNAHGAASFRHISMYDTMDRYQEMAKSRYNLVLGAPGRQAAAQMEKRLGIPYLFLPITYDMEEIAAGYETLRRTLFPDSRASFDFTPHRKRAEAAVKAAREAVGDLPIVIDASAASQPFGLAKALLSYGFSVARVEAQDCMGFDRAHMEWLLKEHPQVEIFQPEHHRAVLFDRRLEKSLAIGVEGAYLAGSKHTADLFNDGGMFGYDGVCRLMALLKEAAKKETDLEELINGYGLVV